FVFQVLGLLELYYCEVPSNQPKRVLKMGPMHLMVFLLLGLFQSSLARACVGCPYNVDVNDPAANQRLKSKLQHAAPKGLATNEMVELVRIKELKEQVVAGFIYSYDFEARGLKSNSLYDCKFVIFEQAWLHREEVKEYRCRVVPSHKQKRSLPGSEFMIDAEKNSDLQELKPIIGGAVGKKLNSKYLMKVVKFFKATEQIVEGSLFRATVEVATTDCLQNSQSEECQILDEDRQICDVQVWYRPWLNKKEVEEVSCRPQPKFCAGCPVEISAEDATAQQCLKRALSNLNAQSHNSHELSLVKINRATSQVVAGVKYTFEFDASDENSGYTCKAAVLSQPWISEDPAVVEFNCAPSSQ
ncbi:cystatin domain-containing protein, partial [Alcanivorax quisquiliarum]